jgi:xanthine dehydrogenase molybdopterin-binding subunit B
VLRVPGVVLFLMLVSALCCPAGGSLSSTARAWCRALRWRHATLVRACCCNNACVCACCIVLQVDPSAALRLPGVVRYFGAKDVPGDNMIGPIMHDEEVFATDTVTCVGQVRTAVLVGVVWCVVARQHDWAHHAR